MNNVSNTMLIFLAKIAPLNKKCLWSIYPILQIIKSQDKQLILIICNGAWQKWMLSNPNFVFWKLQEKLNKAFAASNTVSNVLNYWTHFLYVIAKIL